MLNASRARCAVNNQRVIPRHFPLILSAGKLHGIGRIRARTTNTTARYSVITRFARDRILHTFQFHLNSTANRISETGGPHYETDGNRAAIDSVRDARFNTNDSLAAYNFITAVIKLREC